MSIYYFWTSHSRVAKDPVSGIHEQIKEKQIVYASTSEEKIEDRRQKELERYKDNDDWHVSTIRVVDPNELEMISVHPEVVKRFEK